VKDLVTIVLGFVLTTGVGGWWASKLQSRSWLQQNEVRLREKELDRAGGTCSSVMSLLDARLYRMKRLLEAAAPVGAVDPTELETRRTEYVKVLFEWNDRLNTNLSLVGSHFGQDARVALDELYSAFQQVGRDIEGIVRRAQAGDDSPSDVARIAEQFEGREPGSLNDTVYRFGLLLTGRLRDGTVGRTAPNLP
jgi:hypothetical protein